jgi:hypothetical protein
MRHPIVRGVAAVFAAALVIAVLKIVGLSPETVFSSTREIDSPLGNIRVGENQWFNPLLLMHILAVPALWHLCRRAGYSSWFSLAMLIPLANVMLLYFLAFAEWPAHPREERTLGSSPTRLPPADEPPPRRSSDDIRV